VALRRGGGISNKRKRSWTQLVVGVPCPLLFLHPCFSHAILPKDPDATCPGNIGFSLGLLVGEVGLVERNAFAQFGLFMMLL